MEQIERHDRADIRLSQQGDREAFGRIYDRYAKGVRSVVAAVTDDWNAVEDLTQETFIRAFKGICGLRDHRRLGAWLRGIARMTSREWCRRKKRRSELIEELVASPSDSEADAEQQSLIRSALSRVAALPRNEREVIHSYFFHNQNKTQAAASLGMSRSGYYQTLERALKRLRATLESELATKGSQRHE